MLASTLPGRRTWRPWPVVGALFLLATARPGLAQSTLAQATVELSASVSSNPARIRLRWKPDAAATGYDVHRWNKGQLPGSGVVLLNTQAGADTMSTFTDTTAVVGRAYEYRVRKSLAANGSGEGFVLAGIEVAATDRRGTVVLLVDDTHAAFLAPDLAQLQEDLVGEGWQVVRHDVAPSLPPPQVKALIAADYQADPTQVRAVFIVGHVAVPYSGDIAPDGHPNHLGAWPADVYYGSLGGTWTDNAVSNTGATRPANWNVPGDGRFDQSVIPSTVGNITGAVELEVGRVDLGQLPAFAPLTERDLLRRYLRKDHEFRHRLFAVPERGLVDDQLGFADGEAFANNGWRNFAPLFGLGAGKVNAGRYFSTLRNAGYLWAYSCGYAGYQGMSGVGSAADFARGPVRSVFNLSFGSYFGDWDNPDNYLRAALAADGYTLTNGWAGRPNWFVHSMGLGETIGYGTRRTQPGNDYQYGTGTAGTHTALMGDPTLHLHVLAPPSGLTASANGQAAALSWTASPEPVLGYHIYRATTPAGPFVRLTATPVAGLAYTDPRPLLGTSSYLVRAVALKTSASGSYYNISQGAFGTFVAPPAPPTGGTWRGTVSADWNTPGNWSTGAVPDRSGTALVLVATPFAPVVGSGNFQLASLTLAPQARLTVAAGGRLAVLNQPLVQGAAAGAPPTTLALAAATATQPGGRLEVQEYLGGPQTGLVLSAGTALTVGDGAEVRLLGSLRATAATVSFAPTGRLTFAADTAVYAASRRHYLAGPAGLAVGVLRVSGLREAVELSSPVAVSSQVENDGTLVTNNQLTLRSGPGRQAIIAPVVPARGLPRSFGTFSGNVAVQVYVDGSRNAGLGYRHLSVPVRSPVQMVRQLRTASFAPVVNPLYNSLGNTVTPFPTVFTYDEQRLGTAAPAGLAGFDRGWQSPRALTDNLRLGTGYTVNTIGNQIFNFTGNVTSNGIMVDRLAYGPSPEAGWHFLGNPYPAPLSWDLMMADSSRGQLFNTALYVFKSSGQYTGSYASYVPGPNGTPGVGVNGGSAIVPVGQAFFVRRDTTYRYSSASLNFTLDDLLTTPTGPAVQRPAADLRPRLTLALRDAAGAAHQTAVYFQAGATAGADARYDAALLPGAGQALCLASLSGGRALAINALPPLAGADVRLPLRLQAATAGRYTLALDALANLPAGYRAYLHDATANTYTDLARTPTTAVGLGANQPLNTRYALLFSTQPRVLATTAAALRAQVGVFPNPARGRATLWLPAELRAPRPFLTLRNALGQRVWAGPATPEAGGGWGFSLAGLASGVYAVQADTPAGPVSCRLAVE